MSSSAPQLLLAPESRKDKVSKNDLRYLFRLNKSNQRSRKRAAVDKQIKSEKQDAEKRRRLSNAVGEIKKLRKAASKFRGQGTSKSKKSIDQQTYEESIAVYEGEKLVRRETSYNFKNVNVFQRYLVSLSRNKQHKPRTRYQTI